MKNSIGTATILTQGGSEALLYVCGPEGFIKFVTETASKGGWSAERTHFEYCAAPTQAFADNVGFEVKIAGTGKVHFVPSDKSVAAILIENGIDIQTSCEQGVCGTCVTRVLEGVPHHRDYYLTDDEHDRNDQFTPCCSRARSPMLVLDL